VRTGKCAGQRDAAQPGRAQLLLDRFGEPVDLRLEEVQVREDRADHQRVMRLRIGPPAPA
jgi:hypothetical protein